MRKEMTLESRLSHDHTLSTLRRSCISFRYSSISNPTEIPKITSFKGKLKKSSFFGSCNLISAATNQLLQNNKVSVLNSWNIVDSAFMKGGHHQGNAYDDDDMRLRCSRCTVIYLIVVMSLHPPTENFLRSAKVLFKSVSIVFTPGIRCHNSILKPTMGLLPYNNEAAKFFSGWHSM